MRGYYRFSFIDELTDAAIDTIVAGAEVAPSPMSAVLLQPLGGAFGRVGEMDTALGHRDADWGIQVLAQWPEPERDTSNRTWVRAMTDALAPWSRPAGLPELHRRGRRHAACGPPTAPSATRGGRGQGPLGSANVPPQPQHPRRHLARRTSISAGGAQTDRRSARGDFRRYAP